MKNKKNLGLLILFIGLNIGCKQETSTTKNSMIPNGVETNGLVQPKDYQSNNTLTNTWMVKTGKVKGIEDPRLRHNVLIIRPDQTFAFVRRLPVERIRKSIQIKGIAKLPEILSRSVYLALMGTWKEDGKDLTLEVKHRKTASESKQVKENLFLSVEQKSRNNLVLKNDTITYEFIPISDEYPLPAGYEAELRTFK